MERHKGRGSNRTEQKNTKVKQNGEQVNENKKAYGGYSKYYSSSMLIIMGLGKLFCHREVA